MAKPWSSRFMIRSFHQFASKTSAGSDLIASGISNFIATTPKVIENPSFSSWLLNSQRSHFSSSASLVGVSRKLYAHPPLLPRRNLLGLRHFSLNSEKGSKILGNKLAKKPVLAVWDAFERYKEALRIQIEAFWKRNYMVVLGAGGLVACIVLWRLLFGIATTFIGLSQGMAKYGFLALSSAIVAFTGLYLRSRFTVNPDKVYRMAMRRLNTSAGILEVMGAPLTGTDLRAYVMSGGGITLKNFKPRLGRKRCFLIFPIQGSERKGLVSVEVKKKKGQYDMKLLAVDVPMASGPDQRLFLIGDEEEYRIGDGLISELRDPVVKALAAAKEFEARDIREDEEDDARELAEAEAEAERKHEEAEKQKAISQ